MTELGQTIATTIDDLERTKKGIDSSTGSIYRFNVFSDSMTVDDTYLKISNRQNGTAFILGHPVNGLIETSPLGSGTMGAWHTILSMSGTTAP